MELWHIPLLVAVGTIAGFLNTVAGGGSLLTLPVLIFIGLPSAVANGTNRVALLIQNVSGILGFRRKGVSDFKFSLLIALPALVGSWLGANLAVEMDDALFRKVLAAIMLMVLVLIVTNPAKRWQVSSEGQGPARTIIAMIVFFFIGIYCGFIQAGAGYLIIASLTLIKGFDLVRTNAVKLFVVLFVTIVALGVFVLNQNVNWTLGLTLAIGNATGAWIGSHWAVAKGDKWIRRVLVFAVVAFAIKLLF